MRKLVALFAVLSCWVLSDSVANAQLAYVTYYQPVTVYRPAPVVYSTYYAPAPAPAVVVQPAPVYQPVTQVRTRYRPILGGTVTRTRVVPGYYTPAPVVVAY